MAWDLVYNLTEEDTGQWSFQLNKGTCSTAEKRFVLWVSHYSQSLNGNLLQHDLTAQPADKVVHNAALWGRMSVKL